MDHRPKCEIQNFNSVRRKCRDTLCGFGLDNVFFRYENESTSGEKKDYLDYSKLLNFCHAIDTINQVKRQLYKGKPT